MKKVKHWLHILLVVLTSGLWLLPYVVILATTEMYNRGYKVGKAAGRVERQNEIDDERAKPKTQWVSPVDCRCVAKPIVTESKTRLNRFAELADRNRTVGLDAEERREYFELRQEISR